MPVLLEREVVVISNDGAVRGEVSAVVARCLDARTVFVDRTGVWEAGTSRAAQVVVIDDEGRDDAVDLIGRVKAERDDAAILYLASRHSTALEGEVRRAGASFYTVKSSRDEDLTRVIEVLLGR